LVYFMQLPPGISGWHLEEVLPDKAMGMQAMS